MRASRLTIFVTSLLAGSALFPLIAAAQSTANSQVETVVVTAEKRTEAAKNVPMSLSVVGQDELNTLNIRSFEDLQNQVPGLAVTEADPTHPSLIIRGLNAGGDGSTVGVYIDETPYGSSNDLANGTDTAPNLDTFDMQRVEVLRGPQGTLYGEGTEGGLIKFVTNAPDTTGFDDALEAGVIDMDHGGVGDSFRGMVNVAITDDLAVRVVGFDARTPGYITNQVENLTTGSIDSVKHSNDETSFGGRGSILWTPTDKISVRLNVLQQQLKVGDDNSEDVVVNSNGSFSPLFGDYIKQRTTTEPSGVRYYIYNATVNWDFDFATLTSASSYNNFHDFTLGDDSGLLPAFVGRDVQGFLHQGKFVQEIRLASDPGQGLFGAPLDWLVGFYYANEHDSLHQDVVNGFLVPPAGESVNLLSKYVETTGFANVDYHVTSNFEVGAGLRYATDNQTANESEEIQALGIPLTPVAGGAFSHDILTWSADARYHLDDQTMLYARVATGWRAGGPNDLPPGAPASVPRTFAPDSLTNYELGAKSDLPNENLSFDADIYYIQWQSVQILQLIDNFNIDGNGGAAVSKGVEANVTWQPIDRLRLNVNGDYNDAYFTTSSPILGTVSGTPLPNSPKWSITLNGDYTLLPIGDFTPYIGATWHYTGIEGSGFAQSPFTGLPIPEGSLPSYDTFDFRLGVDWKKWSLEFYGKNLNDAKGITAFAPFGGSAASGLAANVAVIQPRVIGLVLRGKF